MPPALDLTGKTFERLFVIGPAPKRPGNSNLRWRVRCSCKNKTVKVVFGMDLVAGRTTSCGCRHDELAGQRARQMTRHGHASNWNGKRPSREYTAWSAMWDRCTNEKNVGYSNYGEKGVRVAPRWRRFENFLADMGPCPSGHELERKKVFGNYGPKNCIWLPSRLQARNKRKTLWLKHAGVSLPVVAWSEHIGIAAPTLHKRVKLGWRTADVLTKPINLKKQLAVRCRRWRPAR
jgi:hypothetical protein